MNAKSGYSVSTTSPKVRAVPDEWSLLHPDQAGPKAAIRAVPAVNPTTIHDLRHMLETDDSTPEQALIESVHTSTPDEDGVYQLGMPEPTAPSPAAQPLRTVERGAIYSLEFSTRCPHCSRQISTLRVSRLLRTHVSFTSTLPRKGYIIVCPECDAMLSAELSGLI
jgi:hypothetical protein